MTIQKGRAWGAHAPAPPGTRLVGSDREARAVVEAARLAGRPIPVIGLLGGDLCRTLGGHGDETRLRSEAALQVPVDLGLAVLDGARHWFVAHLVARRSWWLGRLFLAMNAQYLGDWDVAPRSHPNDGLLDTFDVTMTPGERFEARRRLATGTHVPHPRIAERRVASIDVRFDRPTPVFLDGVPMGKVGRLSIAIEPDAITCVV